jgi:hypothetical protein
MSKLFFNYKSTKFLWVRFKSKRLGATTNPGGNYTPSQGGSESPLCWRIMFARFASVTQLSGGGGGVGRARTGKLLQISHSAPFWGGHLPIVSEVMICVRLCIDCISLSTSPLPLQRCDRLYTRSLLGLQSFNTRRDYEISMAILCVFKR